MSGLFCLVWESKSYCREAADAESVPEVDRTEYAHEQARWMRGQLENMMDGGQYSTLQREALQNAAMQQQRMHQNSQQLGTLAMQSRQPSPFNGTTLGGVLGHKPEKKPWYVSLT